jgi:hypothetical protein
VAAWTRSIRPAASSRGISSSWAAWRARAGSAAAATASPARHSSAVQYGSSTTARISSPSATAARLRQTIVPDGRLRERRVHRRGGLRVQRRRGVVQDPGEVGPRAVEVAPPQPQGAAGDQRAEPLGGRRQVQVEDLAEQLVGLLAPPRLSSALAAAGSSTVPEPPSAPNVRAAAVPAR